MNRKLKQSGGLTRTFGKTNAADESYVFFWVILFVLMSVNNQSLGTKFDQLKKILQYLTQTVILMHYIYSGKLS